MGALVVGRLELVLDLALMEREPAGAARGVLVEDVDAIAAHAIRRWRTVSCAGLDVAWLRARKILLEVLEQHGVARLWRASASSRLSPGLAAPSSSTLPSVR